MVSLYDLFLARKDLSLHKWHNYFWVYEAHLSKFVGKPVRMLEIGVQQGGSTRLFKEWLGDESFIVGVDIDPACRDIAFPKGIAIETGDQADPAFLQDLAANHGPFDIILDDGGHTCRQITTAFETLFPHVNSGGVYMIEDTCCQFWDGSEFVDAPPGHDFKTFVWGLYAAMNADMGNRALMRHWHVPPDERATREHDASDNRYLKAIHLYESMVAVERGPRPIPYSEWRGGERERKPG